MRYFDTNSIIMQRTTLLLLLVLTFSSLNFAQAQKTNKHGVKALYTGLIVGSEFQKILYGVDLQAVFHNAWGVQLGATLLTEDARKLPSDFYNGSMGLASGYVPKDHTMLFTLLASKRHALAKNYGFSFMLGPNMEYQKANHFELRHNSSIDESNYSVEYHSEYGIGLTGRVGIYWVAANWCGFQVDFVGNLNELRNYAAVCLTWNLGWMGKER